MESKNKYRLGKHAIALSENQNIWYITMDYSIITLLLYNNVEEYFIQEYG